MRALFVCLYVFMSMVFSSAALSSEASSQSLSQTTAGKNAIGIDKVLHVKANEVYLLGKTHQYLQLDELILENGAQLVLDETIEFVSIAAAKAKIGAAVSITARGKSGVSGTDATGLADAKGCLPPQHGAAGGDGSQGARGKDVQLNLNIIEFGDLTIDASGGAGGLGGKGGDGQTADQGESCPLTSGGNAGPGGQAADGGNGGNVHVIYASADGDVLIHARQQTKLVAQGGLGAKGGAAGVAGEGSVGRYIIKKTLSGNKKWVSGGGKGKSAKAGKDSREGNHGRADIQVANNQFPMTVSKPMVTSKTNVAAIDPVMTLSSVNTIAPSQPANSIDTESRLKQLEDKVQLLLKRIEQLEAQ